MVNYTTDEIIQLELLYTFIRRKGSSRIHRKSLRLWLANISMQKEEYSDDYICGFNSCGETL
jgi:hypothetical protein